MYLTIIQQVQEFVEKLSCRSRNFVKTFLYYQMLKKLNTEPVMITDLPTLYSTNMKIKVKLGTSLTTSTHLRLEKWLQQWTSHILDFICSRFKITSIKFWAKWPRCWSDGQRVCILLRPSKLKSRPPLDHKSPPINTLLGFSSICPPYWPAVCECTFSWCKSLFKSTF